MRCAGGSVRGASSDSFHGGGYCEFDSFMNAEENPFSPKIPSAPTLFLETFMRWLFGLSLLWCVAMFVAIALCRAAGASDVHEQATHR